MLEELPLLFSSEQLLLLGRTNTSPSWSMTVDCPMTSYRGNITVENIYVILVIDGPLTFLDFFIKQGGIKHSYTSSPRCAPLLVLTRATAPCQSTHPCIMVRNAHTSQTNWNLGVKRACHVTDSLVWVCLSWSSHLKQPVAASSSSENSNWSEPLWIDHKCITLSLISQIQLSHKVMLWG